VKLVNSTQSVARSLSLENPALAAVLVHTQSPLEETATASREVYSRLYTKRACVVQCFEYGMSTTIPIRFQHGQAYCCDDNQHSVYMASALVEVETGT
jgi:hypothetical protein